MNREEENPKSCYKNFVEKAGEWFDYKDKGEWIQDMKGSISLTASIIATMTFSLATNPPRGAVQAGLNDVARCSTISGSGVFVCVGEAILASYNHDKYVGFLVCNTICFFASLSVCILLVSGFPINNRFTIWLLSVGMCITLITLALTYMFAANMVTPNTIWNSIAGNVLGIIAIVWASLVLIVGIVLMVRFFVRGGVKKFNCYK